MSRHISDVEDLTVYQKAYDASLMLHKLSLEYPKHEQFNGIADQLRRASKSVCANLAEGFGKQSHSKAEFKRYLSIAIGSSDETRLWLRYSYDLGYMPLKLYTSYAGEYRTIAKMLSGLYKRWE